jgi:hypothetical protein
MHLDTIFKVRADTPEDAVQEVNCLLEDSCYDGSPFDYYDHCATAILTEFTEQRFVELRQKELIEYKSFLQKALDMEDGRDDSMKGWYLRMAGESLDAMQQVSTQRFAIDLSEEVNGRDAEGAHTYYVTTDRHH